MLKKICFIIALAMSFPVFAGQSTQNSRTQLPSFFYNSYIGANVGFGKFNFTNTQLTEGFHAGRIENTRYGARVFIGHYLTPYLAIQLSLMRPFRWIYYYDLQGPHATRARQTVWISLFGLLTLKPTWRINDRWWLYGEGGLGLVSRHGFERKSAPGDDFVLLKGGEILTPIIGGGLSYRVSGQWYLDASILYAPAQHTQQQPYTLYGALGFFYYFLPPNGHTASAEFEDLFIFPHNLIEFGYFNHNLFNWEVNKYVTAPYVPIFWNGKIKIQNGFSLMYERNFFHTQRSFSLNWGASVSHWVSRGLRNRYYAFSVFPALCVWIIRSKHMDFDFTYSVAGPTILTRSTIDGIDAGKHFTFQDFMGVGFFLGKNKNININFKIMHYSNGNMFEHNPGIAIPVTVTVGYAF